MKKGDKIILIKPFAIFDNVGEICEIIDIDKDKNISFRFGKYHLGYMSFNELEQHFKLLNSNTDDILKLNQLLEWCKNKDKPFLPQIYHKLIFNNKYNISSIIKIYNNRLYLKQYRKKTFKDSDFSLITICNINKKDL